MRDDLKTRFVLLAAFLVVMLIGCGGSNMTDVPGKTEAHSQVVLQLTPENARSALITLTKGVIDSNFRHGDGPKIVAFLKSKERIEALRNDDVTFDKGYIFIGGWTCNLKDRSFFTVIKLLGGHEYEVNGRFERSDDGQWKAVLLGFAHGNAGPGVR